MKIMSLGQFETDESLEEFRGRPLIVISATYEEIRGLKVSLYDDVDLVSVPATSEDKSNG